MRCTITSTVRLAPAIKEFRLAPADDSAAPACQHGDHAELEFAARTGRRYRNACSLVGTGTAHRCAAPARRARWLAGAARGI